MDYNYFTLAFPIVTAIVLLLFFWYYIRAARPLYGTTEWITIKSREMRFSKSIPRYKMSRRDVFPMLLIIAVYALVAFTGLGRNSNPQTFCSFEKKGQAVVFHTENTAGVGGVMYYTGLGSSGGYTLSFSADGRSWTDVPPESEEDTYSMEQGHADLFKWFYRETDFPEARYVRITADITRTDTVLELGEFCLYDTAGNAVDPRDIQITTGPAGADCLFDEQSLVPAESTYLNSTYFDEIYHARTAYEHIRNMEPYEVSHPPLGKLIIAAGIEMFGMTPFGWRFMGTLFGVAMLAILYIFIKNMFGKTAVAACGTLLFAFDFMHFTQTRISTIDTYSVFFVLLMYFFMYRYLSRDPDQSFRKSLVPLGLCGLFFGIGCAAKWTSVYAGLGLVFLYIVGVAFRWMYYRDTERKREFFPWLIKTVLFSILFFIIIPAVIYCLSYIPYGLAAGMSISGGMLWDSEFYKIIWDNQVFMFTYHSGLDATHPYGSSWYQWVLDIRPILYYRNIDTASAVKSSISAFGNPIVWWGGLLAMLVMVKRIIKNRDGRSMVIAAGYFGQLLPWVIISRVVFIYHYFTCTIFLVLALCHIFNTILERRRGKYRLIVYGYTGASLALFAAFYPVISGLEVSQFYSQRFLQWIPYMWPF